MNFFNEFVEKGIIEKLNKLLNSNFTRIDHEEAIKILKEADVKWEFEPEYGEDIAKEHERYITEYFDGPVFIKNWPKDIKAFYMKQNEDGKTVAAVDLEVPGAGELMGGSQREEDYDKLVTRMEEMGMDSEGLDWYLNLRRYGTCVHSGFGMGFERLLIYLTGVDNIRDVIPYPRTPKTCEFQIQESNMNNSEKILIDELLKGQEYLISEYLYKRSYADMLWERELHQNAIHTIVIIELMDFVDQLLLGYCGGEHETDT